MKFTTFCCLLGACILLAAPAGADPQPTAAPAATVMPKVAEVYPRLAKLKEEKAALESRMERLGALDPVTQALAGLKSLPQQWAEREAILGPPREWSLDNLQQARVALIADRDRISRILDDLFMRLSEIEVLRDEWSNKRQFWDEWLNTLPAAGMQASAEAFSEARQTVETALNVLKQTAPQLFAMQQQLTALQIPVSDRIDHIEELLAVRKNQLFERSHPSFLNPDFYRQLHAGLFSSIGTGLTKLEFFNRAFWQSRGSQIALHLILATVIACLLRTHRKRHPQSPAAPFVSRHPFSTGLFLATIVFSPFYAHAPAGWMLILAGIAVFSAVPLIMEILDNPLQRQVVRLLALAYFLSLGVRTLSLPAPLYSLFIAGVCLSGGIALRWFAAQVRRDSPGRQQRFSNLLKLGAAFLGATFLILAAGYGNLAEHLLHAGLKTVFALLLAALLLRVLKNGLQLLGKLRFFKRQRFFRRHGQELQNRLWHLAPLVVGIQTALYLLVAWHFFDSVGEAWHAILTAGVVLGDKTVSVKMLLVGLSALYVAIFISWLLRSLLEEEVFPRRQVDRGVRDSINKLLNYAILAFGIFMALGLAGIDLKSFAVLAGALGIGIGFGLQNIVNNFISGLILLFERPIKIGDMIVLDGEWGTVRKIGLRSTTVETFDLSEVIVPNSLLVSEKVTNWTLSSEQSRIVVPVGVAYGSPLEKVLGILYDAAQVHPKVLDSPPPSAIFTAFGASSLDFELRVWATSVNDRLTIRNDLLLYIDRRFREEGVEIPFPQHDLHLRSVDAGIMRSLNLSGQPGKDG